MTRAVLYARVSSAGQRDRHTIASQLRTLPEYIAARGWTLARPPGHYVDDGRSAKAGDAREAFARLLADAAAQAFDVVAVVDLDRLTRSEDQGERGAILGTFYRAHIKLAIASTGQLLDLATPDGDLFSALGAWFAAEENRRRRDRTVRGKIEALMKGRKPSGPTPYGLRYDRATGAWSLDPEAAPVVRECYERVAAGESCYRVSIDMQDRDVPRPRSGRWVRSRVHQIVVNPAYRGEWIGDKRRNLRVAVPPLVSPELWDAAQLMLPSARRPVPRAPRSKRWNLIEGIARCGECGAKIGITGGGRTLRNGQYVRYYVCATQKVPRRDRPPGPTCRNRMRLVEDLDAAVWAELCRVLERPDLASAALASRRGRDADDARWERELAGLERQIAALDKAEAAILSAHRRGKVSARAMEIELEAAARHRALLERNRDLARQEIASSRRSHAETGALLASVETLRARVAQASAQERQALARLLVPGRDGLQVTLWRDRPFEIVGRLGTAAAEARTTPASAASSGGVRSGGVLFRVVAR